VVAVVRWFSDGDVGDILPPEKWGGSMPTKDAHYRSLAKAISWRMTGSIDTFVISFILTGHLTIAGSIAGTELLTKIILYFLHERAWGLISWGQS
jgi:uncharacterized membrane protein